MKLIALHDVLIELSCHLEQYECEMLAKEMHKTPDQILSFLSNVDSISAKEKMTEMLVSDKKSLEFQDKPTDSINGMLSEMPSSTSYDSRKKNPKSEIPNENQMRDNSDLNSYKRHDIESISSKNSVEMKKEQISRLDIPIIGAKKNPVVIGKSNYCFQSKWEHLKAKCQLNVLFS